MSAYTGKEYTYEQALNEDLSIVPDVLTNRAYPVALSSSPRLIARQHQQTPQNGRGKHRRARPHS